MLRVGSGTISTAPIAVKWWETMASVNRIAASKVVRVPLSRAAAWSAAAPSTAEHAAAFADRVIERAFGAIRYLDHCRAVAPRNGIRGGGPICGLADVRKAPDTEARGPIDV